MKLKEIFSKLTLNVKLASAAIFLGVVAFIIGNPVNNSIAKVDMQELSTMVQKEVDRVSVETLADWIIKGKSDYRLIDTRTEKEFNEYNIPTSENIPVTNLLDGGLLRNEKIILYADAGTHSAQAWFLLKAKNYMGVYILQGGLEEWKDKILFPKLALNASPEEKTKFDKLAEVSKFFGGVPQTGTSETAMTAAPSLPKLSASAAAPAGGAKKKKREGC